MSILVNGKKIAGYGLPGKSAYKSAVDGGYTGTEEEFNLMLSDYASGGVAKVIHASKHASGGSDPISPSDIGAATATHTHEDLKSQINSASNDASKALSDVSEAKNTASNALSQAQKANSLANSAMDEVSNHTHAPEDIGAATTESYTATVTTAWTADGDYFYQDITVSGILETDDPIVDILSGSDNALNVQYSEAICKVIHITTSNDSIRVWAAEAISIEFPIKLKAVR